MNKVILVGNLTADPETRTTSSGVSMCTFRIAITRPYKDADGNKPTDFIPIIAWRQLGERCGQYLAKGRKVAVSGSLQSRQYEDKTGQKRTAYEVIAEDVEFLTPRSEGGAPMPSPPPASLHSADYDDVQGFTELEDSELPF